MANTLPDINVDFKQRAASFTKRGGTAILIIKDDTNTTTVAEYDSYEDFEADKAKYTAQNLQYIKDIFIGRPYKIVVVRIAGEDETISDALKTIKSLYSTGWISIVGEKTDYDALIAWTKVQRTEYKKTFKSIVYSPTTPPDYEGIVELGNTEVIFKDARDKQVGNEFLPTLLGYIAATGVERGTTYLVMENLKSVLEPELPNQVLKNGQMVLINDENKVKIGLGINSLTTFNDDAPEDFSLIEVIETQDYMLDDIRSRFKNNYVGTYRNTLDNQMLFIGAVNTYFGELAARDILDSNYNNTSFIDVVAQRKAWVDSGKEEAKNWDDETVKQNTFKRKLFLAGNVKILTTMTDLNFVITME
ncbi:phage tail sheath protein [Clostridium sporogenes]|nr:phage tail sheath protein [Clostridium sporogenes]